MRHGNAYQVDGRFYFPTRAIDGAKDFILEARDLPDVARWACRAIDAAAFYASRDLAEPVTIALRRYGG